MHGKKICYCSGVTMCVKTRSEIDLILPGMTANKLTNTFNIFQEWNLNSPNLISALEFSNIIILVEKIRICLVEDTLKYKIFLFPAT